MKILIIAVLALLTFSQQAGYVFPEADYECPLEGEDCLPIKIDEGRVVTCVVEDNGDDSCSDK